MARVQGPPPATGAGVTSLAAPWPVATTAGNLLVMVVAWRGSMTISDVPAGWTLFASGAYNVRVSLYCIPDAASRSGSETVTFSASCDPLIALLEYSGMAAAPLDKTASLTSGGTAGTIASTGTTATTAQADQLWLGAIGNQTATNAQTSPTNGFAAVHELGHGTYRIGAYEKFVSAVGAAECSVTLGSAVQWAGAIGTFAGGGGTALTVADLALSVTLDAPTLTQHHTLTVAESSLGLTLDTPPLTQHPVLAVADLTLGLPLDTPTLGVGGAALSVADLTLSTILDAPTLTQQHSLAVADLTVAVSLDTPTLSTSATLVVHDLGLPVALDTPSLTQQHSLAVAGVTLGVTLDSVSFESPLRLKVLVAGVLHDPELGSLRLSLAVGERSTCTVDVVDESGAARFVKGQPVEVSYDGEVIFGGFVDQPRERYWAPGEGTWWTLGCVDNHYLADKRIVARAWEATTVDAIVTAVHADWLAGEGVTIGQVDGRNTPVTRAVLNYVPASRALDRLAELAGCWWQIDPLRRLWFVPAATLAAPWHVAPDGAGIFADVDAGVTVHEGNPRYRNHQYIRGGRDTTDPQTESFAGDGKRRTFGVGYALAKVPTVTVNAAARTVGIRGVESGRDWYWSKADHEITQEATAAALTAADTLQVTYRGLFDVVVLSKDTAAAAARQAVEQVGSGIVDAVDDEPETTDRAAAFEIAAGRLADLARVGRHVTYTTSRAGLAPGQMQTVTIPRHGLDEPMLVERVDVEEDGPERLRWTVSAVAGPLEGSWTQLFARAVEKPSALNLFENITEAQILAVLEGFPEAWGWAETSPVTARACALVPVTVPFAVC